ncbi:MAG TPA: PQQ-dependent sugar dehydrogenase, partial [Solirubrobacteraceae bacterium]|nr:PQQ-dependent sugar dehydrogenase [Solirubrobacteraceae bacterium]
MTRRTLVPLLALLALAHAAAPASGFDLVELGGTFTQPVYVAGPPGDASQLFVVERPGRIQRVEGGAVTQFLDITAKVDREGGEEGLFSMAFAPDYATSGRYWIYYTADAPDVNGADPPGSDLVVEERLRDDPDHAADVIRIPHRQFSNHNGGQLQVGPDGMLWLATGDGGGGNDPNRNGQNPNTLLGKVLRIDPLPGGGYASPADNPYAAGGGAPEVWAIGLRNPWRFSFDRETDDLWIADVGQGMIEEVDVAPAPGLGRGANYGWVPYEGSRTTSIGGEPPTDHHGPLIEHTHQDGWFAITGGYVIRDPALLCEEGRYVYGDFVKATLYLADPATGATAPTDDVVPQLSSFGEDGAGHVFATSLGGRVFRLVPDERTDCSQREPSSPPPAPPPQDPPPPPAEDAQGAGGALPFPFTISGPGPSAAPGLSAAATPRQRVLSRGRILVRVVCRVGCTATLSGTLRAGARRLPLRAGPRTLIPGRRVTLAARMGPTARGAVRSALR